MKPKRLIIESVVCIAIYAVAFFCWTALFGVMYTGVMPMYDTYSITPPSPPQILILGTFCLISTLVYFIRAAINRYNNNVINAILIISNLLSLLILIWAYPLLDSLAQSIFVKGNVLTLELSSPLVPNKPLQNGATHPNLGAFLTGLIVIFLITLITSGIITFKNWISNAKNELPIS